MSHVIRLREPWVLESGTEGQLQLRRHFQSPPSLRAANHVWLAVAGLPHPARVALNGVLLPDVAPAENEFRHDIGSLLQAHNEVVIELPADTGSPEPLSELAQRLRREVLAAGRARLEID